MNIADFQKDMGLRIKKAREKLVPKVTQEEMSNRLEKSKNAPENSTMELTRYRQWENGYNPVDVRWIPAICELCKCDVGYLFGEHESLTKETDEIRDITGLSELAATNLLIASEIPEGKPQEYALHDDLRNFSVGRFVKIPFLQSLLENAEEWERLAVCAYDYLSEMRKYKAAPNHTVNDIRHDQFADVAKQNATLHLSRLFEEISKEYSNTRYCEWGGEE